MVAILHPTGPGMQIPIDRAVVLIGRSPECDVVLDVSSKISRMHCALVQVDAQYFIRDLGSLNGVTVGGQRVEKDAKLTNGTEVQIGDVKFLFLENVVPTAKPAKTTPAKATPVFVNDDVTGEVLDVEEIEIVETTPSVRTKASSAPDAPTNKRHMNDDVQIIDAEIIEDVEVVEDVDIVDDVDVIDIVDVVEEVEIVEDVDIIEDVEVIDIPPQKNRPRPRLR